MDSFIVSQSRTTTIIDVSQIPLQLRITPVSCKNTTIINLCFTAQFDSLFSMAPCFHVTSQRLLLWRDAVETFLRGGGGEALMSLDTNWGHVTHLCGLLHFKNIINESSFALSQQIKCVLHLSPCQLVWVRTTEPKPLILLSKHRLDCRFRLWIRSLVLDLVPGLEETRILF